MATTETAGDARLMGLRDVLRQRRGDSAVAPELPPLPETALTVVRDDGSFVADDGSTIHSRGYLLLDPLGGTTQVGEDDWLRESGCRLSKIAGVTHHAGAAQEASFAPGSVVLLARDPENPADAHAVGVFDVSGEHQAGFVPAALAQEVSERIEGGDPLGGVILREYRTEPEGGRRLGLVMLIAPAGKVRLRVEPAAEATPDG